MKICRKLTLLSLLLAPAVAAEELESTRSELQSDVVLRALVDELSRSRDALRLEDLPEPYFIEYALVDANTVSVSALLGSVSARSENRSRRLRTDVRVGSYELDNTNFRGGGGFFGFGGFGGSAALPIEDDYYAMRQAVWWQTDRQYKRVAETLVKKKAFMESKTIEDKPDDFSREEPSVYFEPRIDVSIDADGLEKLAVELSRVFRAFPLIQSSGVTVTGAAGNKYLANTEGTRIRTAKSRYTISINATVQAEDGMKLSGSISFPGRTPADWPVVAELTASTRELIEELLAVRAAPVLESYSGPILFDPQAAASLFLRYFGRGFPGGQRSVGGRTGPDDFSRKIGKRILPRTMTVIDDPTREMIDDVPVMGHYRYDDQGVPARAVQLVQKGRLQAQLMSRNPSREFDRSTGHGRGSMGVRSSAACLVVADEKGLNEADLKTELIEAASDEDLEFAIRIASFGSVGSGGGGPFGAGFARRSGGTIPLMIYKVFPDGREELVRGVESGPIDIKGFKRLLAVGDTAYVLNQVRGGGMTVAAPAMLFEELDLAKIDRDFDRPPVLDAPLARKAAESSD